MPLLTEQIEQYIAEQGYLFFSEVRNDSLANNGTLFLKIAAGTRPVALVFDANVEALTYVESFTGTTLTTPTTLTINNYNIASENTASAVVTSATAASVAGTQRGTSQKGSGGPSFGAGGSSQSRPTFIPAGGDITLKLTNVSGTAKSIATGVYFTELF